MIRVLSCMAVGAALVAPPQAAADRIALEAIAVVLDAPAPANRVWPEFSLPARTFAVQTPAGVHLHTSGDAPAGFIRQDRTWFHAGPLPGLGNGIAIDHPIGALRAVVVPVAATAERTAQTLYHEAFHAFQRELARARPPVDSASLAITADQAASIEVERRVLAEALRQPTSPAQLLREALAVRRERSASGGERLEAAERFAEWNEGLAEYVAQASIALAVKRSAALQHLAVARSLGAPLSTMGGSPDERLVRSRSYATGAALGFLLDRLRPGWQVLVSKSSLDEVAADTVELQDGAVADLAARARTRHGYDALRTDSTPPWGSLTVMSEAAFDALGSFRIIIEMSSAARTSFNLVARGRENDGMHRPRPGLLLLPNPARLELTDGPLSVSVRGRPVRLADGRGEGSRTATILIADTPLLEGKPIPPGERTVSSLALLAGGVEIKSSGPVKITALSDRLIIRREN